MVAARPIAAALTAAGVLVVLVAGPAPAPAVTAAPARPGPWATVNVCDTAGHPDAIGVRGAMPGTGDRRDTLLMRFQLQFLRRSDERWARVGRAGDSGLIEVGHGDARLRQAGRTFTVAPPPAGRPPHLMRAVVTFEWRRDDELLRRTRRITSPGHPFTAGADPASHSAATCSIR